MHSVSDDCCFAVALTEKRRRRSLAGLQIQNYKPIVGIRVFSKLQT